MALDITKSLEIIEIMENYISTIRPPQEIRQQLDIGYEIENQSIIIYEIRPDVSRLKDFLKIVDEDKHSCFKG